MTKSNVVYPGLTCFNDKVKSIEPEKIPGLCKSLILNLFNTN